MKMEKYIWSPSVCGFFPTSEKDFFLLTGKWPDDGVEISEDEHSVLFPVPEGKCIGDVNGMPAWVNPPQPPSSELRKAVLTELSSTYQDDIEKLNRAWLAAAVNDGVNETTKKDLVLAQINARKTQYANDRATIIAQYPI